LPAAGDAFEEIERHWPRAKQSDYHFCGHKFSQLEKNRKSWAAERRWDGAKNVKAVVALSEEFYTASGDRVRI
jgi:hypothetical protein